MGWMMGAPLESFFASMGEGGEAFRTQRASEVPVGHIPPDKDCAKAVYFLLSDYASEITGAALALPAFLLEGADVHLDHMVAQRNAVARIGAGAGKTALFGMGEGKADVAGHGAPRWAKSYGEAIACPT